MKKNVLITGFEPFGGDSINPSIEAVNKLPEVIDGASIYKMEVPSVFTESIRVVTEKIESIKPDIVILVGQAGGREAVSIERVAINMDDARIPDKLGNQPIDTVINHDDLPAYFATIPIKAIVSAIKKKDIPALVSNSAGTYICNHLMFGALSYINRKNLNIRCGFIHVPYIPEQLIKRDSKTPSLPLADITKALKEVISTALAVDNDIKVSGGLDC